MAGVDPFGRVYATVAKNGTWMGNRGNLRKSENKEIIRQWGNKRWVYCVCEGKRIDVVYTKLFFLDEAAALAAGHRPCKQCQPERYLAFKKAWTEANPEHGLDVGSSIDLIDKILDQERKNSTKGKGTYSAVLNDLPEGVFVELSSAPGVAWCYRNGHLYPWNIAGYGSQISVGLNAAVTVLTPRSVVHAIKMGFRPR